MTKKYSFFEVVAWLPNNPQKTLVFFDDMCKPSEVCLCEGLTIEEIGQEMGGN